jgi:carbonic anhydrase
LADSSRVISDAIQEGRAAVVGLSYKLDEGRAELVSGIGEL